MSVICGGYEIRVSADPPGGSPRACLSGIGEQVGRDEEDDDEHDESGEEPGSEKPPVPERDEEDRGDHGSHRRENAEQESPGLQVHEALLSLDVPRVDPHAQLFSLCTSHKVPHGAHHRLRLLDEAARDLCRLLTSRPQQFGLIVHHDATDERQSVETAVVRESESLDQGRSF